MIKCSECGYENMDGLDYCDGCGAKLAAASGSSAAAAPAAAPATETTPPELVWQVSRTDRDTAQMLEVMRATGAKLLFEPGTSYRYSNTGFVLLGVVIEKASGTVKLEGVFPGYEGVYTYPLRISSGS